MSLLRFALSACCILSTCVTAFGQSQDILLYAEVFGDQGIEVYDGCCQVQNQDFTITGSSPLADGIDEATWWTFATWRDSTNHRPFEDFQNIASLNSAKLVLGLDTRGGEVFTDWVELQETGFGNIDEVQNIPAQITIEFEIDLFAHADKGYSPESVRDVLVANQGRMEWKYEDDAVLIYARIEVEVSRLCASIEWNNPSGGDFSNAANWLDLEVPGADTTAVFRMNGRVAFSQDVSNLGAEIGAGVVLDLAGHTYTLSEGCSSDVSLYVLDTGEDGSAVQGGGSISTSGHVVLGATDQSRWVIHDDAILAVGEASPGSEADLRVGINGSEVRLDVLDGGWVDASGTVAVETDDVNVFLTADGAGSQLSGQRLVMSGDGSAYLQVAGGADAEFETAELARDGRSVDVTVSGSNSSLAVDTLDLGVDWRGTLRVENDAELIVGGRLRMGIEEVGGMATLALVNAVALLGELIVGVDGYADVLVDEGFLWVNRLQVSGSGDEGFPLLVTGPKASVLAVEIDIGTRPSLPALTRVYDGGRVQAKQMHVGKAGNGSELAVDSGVLQIADLLVIGENGADGKVILWSLSGSPSHLHGDQSPIGYVAVGLGEGSRGTLEVMDRSTVDIRDLLLGAGGHGSLVVAAGGLVRADEVHAPIFGGSAEITVGNAGMKVGELSCGSGGPGSVRISNNGVARVGTLVLGSGCTLDATGGTIRATIQTAGKGVAEDSTGVVVDTLFISRDAVVLADTLATSGMVVGGSYAWTTDYTNDRGVSPGDSLLSTGDFRVNADYLQTATGALHIEIAGTVEGEFDRLLVDGTARLGGMLTFDRIKGYVPELGSTYEIVRAGSIEGAFDSIEEGDFRAEVVYGEGTVTLVVTSSVATEPPSDLPSDFALDQNYPNPFNPVTTIGFSLPESRHVTLEVYDAAGRRQRTLVDAVRPAGRHEVTLDAANLPSGVYLYRIRAGTYQETRQLVLVR